MELQKEDVALKRNWKNLIGPLIIVVILAIVIISGIRSGDLIGAIRAIRAANPWYLVACGLCYLAYVLFDALGIRSALRSAGYTLSIPKAVKVTVTGEFYSNITPGASGGQPMQIYHLHKNHVPAGIATSALMTHFIAFRVMLTVLMTVLGIANFTFIQAQVGNAMPLLIIGYVYNALMVAVVILLCITAKPVKWAIDKLVCIVEKLHLTKNAQAVREKLFATVETFYKSMGHLSRHKAEIIRQLLFTGLQLISLMMVLVFVFHGLGLVGANPVQLITMGLAQYITTSYVPMPGASGAQEGVFSLFFSKLFPGSSCFAGMMLWRFMTYYLCLIIGTFSLVLSALTERHKARAIEKTKHEQILSKLHQAKEELKTAGAERALELRETISRLEEALEVSNCTKQISAC